MTTLELHDEDTEIQLRIVTKLNKYARRAYVRSFLTQISPWIRGLDRAAIDHAQHGTTLSRRAKARGAPKIPAAPIDSLSGKFGFEIRIQRLKLGMTQTELGRRAGIRRSHLSQIERGLYLPRSTTRRAIAEILGMDRF